MKLLYREASTLIFLLLGWEFLEDTNLYCSHLCNLLYCIAVFHTRCSLRVDWIIAPTQHFFLPTIHISYPTLLDWYFLMLVPSPTASVFLPPPTQIKTNLWISVQSPLPSRNLHWPHALWTTVEFQATHHPSWCLMCLCLICQVPLSPFESTSWIPFVSFTIINRMFCKQSMHKEYQNACLTITLWDPESWERSYVSFNLDFLLSLWSHQQHPDSILPGSVHTFQGDKGITFRGI